MTIFPLYCKVLSEVSSILSRFMSLVPSTWDMRGSGLNVSLRMTKWKEGIKVGRRKGRGGKGREVTTTPYGIVISHCVSQHVILGLPGLLCNSFIFPLAFYTPPILKVLCVLYFSRDCGFVTLVAEPSHPCERLQEQPQGATWAPAPTSALPPPEVAQPIPLTESSEKQGRRVTFLSYLHCRSPWMVSRLLSSSIWHRKKPIIPEASYLVPSTASQRLRGSARWAVSVVHS